MHRARIFSLSAGLLFSGMAIGPWLGGQIIHYTGDLLSVFYFAAAIHLCSSILWLMIVPESLQENVRLANKAAQEERLAKDRLENPRFSWGDLFKFLQPLKMLLPRDRLPGDPRGRGKDWNLTLLVGAHACAMILMGSYPYKMAYAGQAFGWGPEGVSFA
jgi:MFS family permease